MVENLRAKDKDPKERLKKLEAEFDSYFQTEDRTSPQSPWMHALSDLCDYFDSIVNKIIAEQQVEKAGNSKENHINEEGLLTFVKRKSFGNDEYGLAHKQLFKVSASLQHAYEATYFGKGSVTKARRFLFNKKNAYLQGFIKQNVPNK